MTSDALAQAERQRLQPPEDTALPLFAYGNLKIGELGVHGHRNLPFGGQLISLLAVT